VIGLAAVLIVLAALAASARVWGKPGPSAVISLTFPRTVTYEQAVAAARSLAGLLPPWWRRPWDCPAVTIELRATPVGVAHVLTMPAARVEYVIGSLRAAIPGLRVTDEPSPLPSTDLVRELRVSGVGSLRTNAAADTNTGILASLQPLAGGESAVIQYVIAPTAPDRSPGPPRGPLQDGGVRRSSRRRRSSRPSPSPFASGSRLRHGHAAPNCSPACSAHSTP
jgi:hypothetical protein